MTNFNADDTRISAYVLGELSEEEKVAFESDLASSEPLRVAVDETREAIATLQSAFESEAASFAASYFKTNEEKVVINGRSRQFGRRRRRIVGLSSAAAVVLVVSSLAVVLPVVWFTRNSDSKRAKLANRSVKYESAHSERHDSRARDSAPVAGKDQIPVTDGYRVKLGTQANQLVAEGAPDHSRTADQKNATEISLGFTRDSFSRDANKSVHWEFTTADGAELASPTVTMLDDSGVGPGSAGDRFDPIVENEFRQVSTAPLSTFSIDVDTASYAKTRQYLLQHGSLPRPDAVRIEELLNYFSYDYETPAGDDPFSANIEIATCPWQPNHRLVRIGLKGKEFPQQERPATNLVFLLDVSGSMNQPNKLPLLKRGMKLLVDQLGENDQVAIVVYAGAAGLVLEPTRGDQKASIMEALDRLHAGGSTNGGDGIRLSYQTALDNFVQGGVNRVVLCTDGDFNVGVTGTDQLVQLAETNARTGVFLSVFGFGMGNHNDAMLEQISNRGNGNYGFIDTDAEARKVFVEQLSGTLVTIAKDVKIQVEFNPLEVSAYRLIGYENRVLAAEDFNDDKKDAGEIGAGHTVTALYEVIRAGAETDVKVSPIDNLKYQNPSSPTEATSSGEMLTLKLRYKQPDGDSSKLLSFPVKDQEKRFGQASRDFRFAAAVASFGMLLRDSKFKGNANWENVLEIATEGASNDQNGYRAEFLEMVRSANRIAGN